MTPKEKANELYNEFDMIIYTDQDHYKQVKQCVLLVVNELKRYSEYEHLRYWDDVIQELELL